MLHLSRFKQYDSYEIASISKLFRKIKWACFTTKFDTRRHVWETPGNSRGTFRNLFYLGHALACPTKQPLKNNTIKYRVIVWHYLHALVALSWLDTCLSMECIFGMCIALSRRLLCIGSVHQYLQVGCLLDIFNEMSMVSGAVGPVVQSNLWFGMISNLIIFFEFGLNRSIASIHLVSLTLLSLQLIDLFFGMLESHSNAITPCI
ncbi:hypothetical protein DFH27DRAFT_568939 [Peziza echinospora]|nr:hypothetical protein DFH27DRAFT_568939 [Peziza echinospora]